MSLRASSQFPATSSAPGTVELATDAEAKAVTSTTLAVTPGNLAAVFAEPPALGSTTPAAVNATTVRVADGTAGAPAIAPTSDTNSGLYSVSPDVLGVSAGGVLRMTVASSGISSYAGAFLLPSTGHLGWGNASIGTIDTFLYRDAADTLALRNSTSAQKFSVYHTFTDSSNYERGALWWASNSLLIGTENAGTGTGRQIIFRVGNTNRWQILTTGHLIASTDNTYDIGASGATRPRDYYGAGKITSAGATAGIGYATGAGGTVTQATDKSTGVTLNKVTGQITTHNATLDAGAEVGFTVTNSAVAATDVVIVNIASGATADSYNVGIDAVASGSFRITLTNVSASNLGEAIVLNFAVLKGVTA
jgi:hypothetical protein